MVPREYLTAFLISNSVALLLLIVAFWKPRASRWLFVLMFVAAAFANTRMALTRPEAYLDYAALAVSSAYREFITGWFAQHVQLLVLPIAAGQLTIAALLTRSGAWRRLGVAGSIVFLLAIAPLGVGSAFPFSLTVIAAMLVMEWKMTQGAEGPSLPGWGEIRQVEQSPQRKAS